MQRCKKVTEELICSSKARVEVLANRISRLEDGLAKDLELLEQRSRSVQSVHQPPPPESDICINSLPSSFLEAFQASWRELQLSHLQEVQQHNAELQRYFDDRMRVPIGGLRVPTPKLPPPPLPPKHKACLSSSTANRTAGELGLPIPPPPPPPLARQKTTCKHAVEFRCARACLRMPCALMCVCVCLYVRLTHMCQASGCRGSINARVA